MSVVGSNILAGSSGQSTGYSIDQSMYFGDAPNGSPRISRQFDKTGSVNPKWTFATWIKKGPPTTSAKTLYYFRPLTVHSGANVEFYIGNDAAGETAAITTASWPGVYNPSLSWNWSTAGTMALFDYGAWYHICHVVDYSTAPYVYLYINGVLTDNSTIWGAKTGTQAYRTNFSPVSGDTFMIGGNYSAQAANAYFADTYWIEQQALTAASFGEINEDTGQFVPIEYTGTYSGNSFFLNYADSSDFGADQSGLSNDFTVASIPARQQVLDTPTNNYFTLNPVANSKYAIESMGMGNLFYVGGSTYSSSVGTIAPTSGKWYTEVYVNANTGTGNSSWLGVTRLGYPGQAWWDTPYNRTGSVGLQGDGQGWKDGL